MIRSVRELTLVLLGAVIAILIYDFKEPWALIPVALCVPWGRLSAWAWSVIVEWVEWKEVKRIGSEKSRSAKSERPM